jgi:hypothetical protein
MKKIFYEKVGNRYKPIKEYDDTFMSAYPKGTHLVVCKPGTTSFMYGIDPAFAPMTAAGKYAENEMSQAIVKGLEMKPKQTPITERQRELWIELKNSFADQDFVIHGAAAADATREGIKALEQEVEKMLTNPAVKLAYEHFMLVWQLTKEQQKEVEI